MDRLEAWWILAGVPGWGVKRVQHMVRQAGSLELAVELALDHIPNTDHWLCERLEVLRSEKIRGSWVIAWDSADYPQMWRELPDPPLVVFGRGEACKMANSDCHVAVVGTRNCTAEARHVAFKLGKALAQRRAIVVSGLARGIDAAALRGACYVGCRTLGILGTGVGSVQPQSSIPISKRMMELGGAIISERPSGMPVHGWHFAARNRLVVSLSDAVVVVQSPSKGGALISAQFALDFGVTCWVYRPESGLNTLRWAGNRRLLNEFPTMGWQSTEKLADCITGDKRITNSFVAEQGLPLAFRSTWRHIMETRGAQLDTLAMLSGIDSASMRKQLHTMELGGWVRRMPGGWFVPLKI